MIRTDGEFVSLQRSRSPGSRFAAHVHLALLLVLTLMLPGCSAQNQSPGLPFAGPAASDASEPQPESASASVAPAAAPDAAETAGGEYRIAARDTLQFTVFQ